MVKLTLRGESVPGQLYQRSSDHYGTLRDGDPHRVKALRAGEVFRTGMWW